MEFKELCREQGFRHVRGRYFRCIGDGVLQGIFKCHKCYIDAYSPEYSEQQRKGYYISFGLWSLYSKLPEYLFDFSQSGGIFAPSDILGKRQNGYPFQGPLSDEKIMAEHGFPFLNEIRTQERLADAIIQLTKTEYKELLPFQTDLCGPLLKSGRNMEALSRVEARFTSLWIGFFEQFKDNVESGVLAETLEEFDWKNVETHHLFSLWSMIVGRQKWNLENYLHNNYTANMERVKLKCYPLSTVDKLTKI